jgi:hypothetical protein
VLPALPAWALLAARWTSRLGAPRTMDRALAAVLVGVTLAGILLLAAGLRSEHFERKSMRALVADYDARRAPGQARYFVGRRPFSGSFYSQGQAKTLPDLRGLSDLPAASFVVMGKTDYEALPPALRARLAPVSRRDGRLLAQTPPPS